jgi:serine/threonine protein kinase/tetratricopeptide (TPR) repeat protein
MSRLSPGDLCIDRFQIECVAGSGGMGTLYRATDTRTGEAVGIKVLHQDSLSTEESLRFHREARILSALRHPGITRYVDHGVLPSGQAYLAMEWLEGETLAERLARTGLTLGESLRCIRATAAALAVAHGQGIVHRDIKPSNLLLRRGEIDRVAVLDFGIARKTRATQVLTRTGAVIGTPGYMAPEQARGQSKLTPAVDVFSLGCVLFECLTGAPPFVGEHVAAVLTQILFETLPDVRQLRPELPESVANLLSALLARSELQRPVDAQAVVGLVDPLLRSGLPDLAAPARDRPQPTRLGPSPAAQWGKGEQELVSVLLCALQTDVAETVVPPGQQPEPASDGLASLMTRLDSLPVQPVPLPNGTLVFSFLGSWGAATDQAGQAARCALLLHEAAPLLRMAIATGRGALVNQVPFGEALERATGLLPSRPAASGESSIGIDKLTAGLLDSRFAVHRGAAGDLYLDPSRLDSDQTRQLLGRPTPFVGREHELSALELLLHGVIEENSSRAMVITAAAGVGKSRLRHEFLHRVANHSEPVKVLQGRCDPMLMNVPLGVLAETLRRHLGIRPDEGLARGMAQLTEHLAALPGVAAPLECELLGELIGLHFPDGDLPLLAAARQDGKLFRSLLQRALIGWLRRECTAAPVLLVIEDLHWSDLLSVTVLEDALRSLNDVALAVLALARPDVVGRFPKLWSGQAQVIPLRPLGRRACERLIAQVLDSRCTPEQISELVELSEGNALFLEELIRYAAEPAGGQRPETVVALLQSRISRLDGPSRRILRLGSIFGESFPLSGIAALVDESLSRGELASWLAVLCRSELIQERSGRAADLGRAESPEREYRFRHALLRDAAYGLLTQEEAQTGHRAAALFLERTGGATTILIAEHMLRSGDPSAALPYLMRAASSAWTQASPHESLRLIEKALAAGAAGTLRGEFLAIKGAASVYIEDNAMALACAREARQLLPPASRYWYLSLNTSIVVAGLTADVGALLEAIQRFESVEPTAAVAMGFGEAAGVVGSMYATLGQRLLLERLVDRCRSFVATHGSATLPYRALAPMQIPKHFLHRMFLPRPFSALSDIAQSVAYVDRAGEQDMSPIFIGLYAKALMDVGRFTEAAELIERLSGVARQSGDSWGETLLAFYAVGGPVWPVEPAALAKLGAWIAGVRNNPKAPALFQSIALSALAHVRYCQGDLSEALSLAQASCGQLQMMPTRGAAPKVVISQVRLAQGDAAAALAVAEEALAVLAQANASGVDELPLRLCQLQALRALGEKDALFAAAQGAHAALAARRGDAPDQAAWQQYLTIPCHGELLTLCERVLGPQS